jgi:allantoinase
LDDRKGAFVAGTDADIVIWDSEEEFIVEPDMIHHRHKLTPYVGNRLQGVVQSTFLRGRKVFDRSKFIGEPAGLLIGTGAV